MEATLCLGPGLHPHLSFHFSSAHPFNSNRFSCRSIPSCYSNRRLGHSFRLCPRALDNSPTPHVESIPTSFRKKALSSLLDMVVNMSSSKLEPPKGKILDGLPRKPSQKDVDDIKVICCSPRSYQLEPRLQVMFEEEEGEYRRGKGEEKGGNSGIILCSFLSIPSLVIY